MAEGDVRKAVDSGQWTVNRKAAWLRVVVSHPCDNRKSQGWGTGDCSMEIVNAKATAGPRHCGQAFDRLSPPPRTGIAQVGSFYGWMTGLSSGCLFSAANYDSCAGGDHGAGIGDLLTGCAVADNLDFEASGGGLLDDFADGQADE